MSATGAVVVAVAVAVAVAVTVAVVAAVVAAAAVDRCAGDSGVQYDAQSVRSHPLLRFKHLPPHLK